MLISGSWFCFQHHNDLEGGNWNAAFRSFSAGQWRTLLADMAGIGMEYLVLMSSASECRTFYPSKHFASFPMGCDAPMDEVFDAADQLGMKIFVSNDFFADAASCRDVFKMFSDPEITARRRIAMEELAERYGNHRSFYGWYWPNELDIHPYFHEEFIRYVNDCGHFAETLLPGSKTLIAPYGTSHLRTDDQFCRLLDQLEVDFIAYQDEVGVRKARYDLTPFFFERLKAAHDKVGKAKLWADVEVFEFEGQIYASPLRPAASERIINQLEAIAPYVERILIFQYQGIMNKPGSAAHVPVVGASKLYTDYYAWRQAYLHS